MSTDAKKVSENVSFQQSKKVKRIPFSPTIPQKANITELSPQRLEQAYLVEASKIAHFEGFDSATKYLKSKGLTWYIDEKLSNPESLVLIKPTEKGSLVKIAYRGTDVSNVVDLASDAGIAASLDRTFPQYRRGDAQLKSVIATYGKPNELIGFSLGGNRAISLGTAYKIPVQAFNPFIGGSPVKPSVLQDLLFSNFAINNVNITRTSDDIASLGLAFTRAKNIETINPFVDAIDFRESHALTNFLSNGERVSLNDSFHNARAVGTIGGLVSGFLGEQTLLQIEKHTGLKPTNNTHAIASGFLSGVYTLPLLSSYAVSEVVPVVSAATISSLASNIAFKESSQPLKGNQKIKQTTAGAVAGATGTASLILSDALLGSRIGGVLGAEGIAIGAFVGGLIGLGGSLIRN